MISTEATAAKILAILLLLAFPTANASCIWQCSLLAAHQEIESDACCIAEATDHFDCHIGIVEVKPPSKSRCLFVETVAALIPQNKEFKTEKIKEVKSDSHRQGKQTVVNRTTGSFSLQNLPPIGTSQAQITQLRI